MSQLESEFIEESFSCREGKGTEYGVQTCRRMIEECSENYTRDAYIMKCDLKSFFMSLDKRVLLQKLYSVIDRMDYSMEDNFFMKWVLSLIVMHCPQKQCFKKNPGSWNGLPPNKSLFYCDDYHGLPIGNLTSQIFANYFLNEFDHYVKDRFNYYGRYVDDFYIISTSKDELLAARDVLRKMLADLGVTLHPNKVYLQHVSKGVTFVGGTIKPHRVLITRRTKASFFRACEKISNSIESGNLDPYDVMHYSCVVNSYLGFLKHRASKRIKNKLPRKFPLLFNIGYYNPSKMKFIIFQDYCLPNQRKEKHASKEFFNLINKPKECINLVHKFMLMPEMSLSQDQMSAISVLTRKRLMSVPLI